MSVERGESEVGSKGRAVHRKDSSATGASSVHSGSAASVPLVEPLAHMVRTVIVGSLCITGQDFAVMHFEIIYSFPCFCRCKISDFTAKAAAVARAEKQGMGTGMAGQVLGEAAPGGGGIGLMSGLGGQGLMR